MNFKKNNTTSGSENKNPNHFPRAGEKNKEYIDYSSNTPLQLKKEFNDTIGDITEEQCTYKEEAILFDNALKSILDAHGINVKGHKMDLHTFAKEYIKDLNTQKEVENFNITMECRYLEDMIKENPELHKIPSQFCSQRKEYENEALNKIEQVYGSIVHKYMTDYYIVGGAPYSTPIQLLEMYAYVLYISMGRMSGDLDSEGVSFQNSKSNFMYYMDKINSFHLNQELIEELTKLNINNKALKCGYRLILDSQEKAISEREYTDLMEKFDKIREEFKPEFEKGIT